MNMISKLFEYDIGIDLGTANVWGWVKGEGLVLDEPTVVTVVSSTRKILAVGEEAKRMLDSTPGNLIAVRPVLTGGGALLPGLDKRLADVIGLPVRVADDPAHAVIRGVGRVLDELRYLAKKTPEQQVPTA